MHTHESNDGALRFVHDGPPETDPENHNRNEKRLKTRAEAAESRVMELEHALKVCHADADRALLSGIRGDYQNALLTIRLTAGNAIA